jgi:hypothetical protein
MQYKLYGWAFMKFIIIGIIAFFSLPLIAQPLNLTLDKTSRKPMLSLEELAPIIQHNFEQSGLSNIGIEILSRYETTHLGINKGLLIKRILPHSPAKSAKLHPTSQSRNGGFSIGDVIIAINHRSIFFNNKTSTEKLLRIPSVIKSLTILRSNKKYIIPIKPLNVAKVN